MRINARLDDASAKKPAYLRHKTRDKTTDIIKRSIDLYYESVAAEERAANQALLDSGFVGCGEDTPDLSSRYKTLLTESLEAKHPSVKHHHGNS